MPFSFPLGEGLFTNVAQCAASLGVVVGMHMLFSRDTKFPERQKILPCSFPTSIQSSGGRDALGVRRTKESYPTEMSKFGQKAHMSRKEHR